MATGGKNETSSNLLKVGTLTLKSDDLNPAGVVVVGDKLVITDYKYDKVLVFRLHDGTLLSSSDKMESRPRGLCRVNDTEFCVAMSDGIIASIAIMAVNDSGRISRSQTFHFILTFDYCSGVALWNDNIVVSGVKDNTICWCVVSLKDGRPDKLHKVSEGRFSFLTVKQDMVYVACPVDRGVYGFNLRNPRQPTYEYKLRGPYGITVDDVGHLFVCDYNNPSIHHLTEKCELIAIYKNEIPRRPVAIFWDRGVLYVTSQYSNEITKYKTPQQGTDIPAKAKIEVDRADQKEKSQPVLEKTRASKKAKVSQKQVAKISPFGLNVDPVEQVTQKLSETGIHESILRQLSKDLISKDWRFFFRELSVPDREIDQIEIDYHNSGVREQIYRLLCRSKVKGILNKDSLIKALQEIDKDDLVDKYTQKTFPDS